ncbi:MAG: beta-eliminating lyase-related protein [Solirubrobacteraceae bacterium]|jgi:threonine aldolase
MRSFASDNHAGAPPEILAALAAANVDHAPAYGEDAWTQRAAQCFRELLGEQARAYPVWGGTAANVLALRATCQPWEGVACTTVAHIHVHECGAPERIAGVKLHPLPTLDGKLVPEQIDPLLASAGDEHAVQLRLVSVAQATELGTSYTPDELRALSDHAHERGLLLHLDGARLANAAAFLGVPLRALTTDAGVDVVSFGATKLGAIGAEAVVLLREDLAPDFGYLRMQTGQLASKMRFLAAQLVALLTDDLWLRLASHANAMAARLAAGAAAVPGVRITQPVESNHVFACLPHAAIAPLQKQWPFYVWDAGRDEVRWLCSWDTTAQEVDDFIAALGDACG